MSTAKSYLLFFCVLTVFAELAAAAARSNPQQLIVRFADTAQSRCIDELCQLHGLEVKKRFQRPPSGSRRFARSAAPGALVLLQSGGPLTPELMESIAGHPEVAYVEPNYIRQLYSVPSDPDFNLLWGLQNTGQQINGTTGTAGKDIGYLTASALERPAGAEVVVVVADSGVSIQHPDLRANIWTHPAEIPDNGVDDDANGYIDDVQGYDLGEDTPNMVDRDGHGTHVAGTIGAVRDNGVGIAGVFGPTKLLPLKIESSDGNIYLSSVIEAYLYAATLKARGVNIVAFNASFGGSESSAAELEAIEIMNATGIILCAAAGNDSVDNDTTPSYPANYDAPNVLSVAASDQNHNLAGFSNYGSTTVDLAAPGTNIFSTRPLQQIAYTSSLTSGGDVYFVATLEHAGTTPEGLLTATVLDCGLGFPEDFPPGMDGQIALVQRGGLTFSAKVENAMAAGASGVLIYQNTAVAPGQWTLGYESNWIPALQLDRAEGLALLAELPVEATMSNQGDLDAAYQFLNGTSMATPHVTGAVAFAALNFPDDTLTERINRILDAVTPVPALASRLVSGGVLDLQKLIDSDADELGDWWEGAFFGNLAKDGTADSDGDSSLDSEEFFARTDPTSGLSFIALESSTFDPAIGTTLQFQSAVGRRYDVFWSRDLTAETWEVLETGLIGDGSRLTVIDPASTLPGLRFYRLRVYD